MSSNCSEENVRPDEEQEVTPAEETEVTPAEETETAEEAVSPEEALRAELAGEKDKYLRLAAEYDNYRRRSSRERERIFADVKKDVLTKILPIYDNLERALKQETADEAYRKGVEMTMHQFEETLKGLGVTAIEAVGETFDPNIHNAVMHTEDPEKGENEIVAEFQKGFRMGDDVIRVSMVQVAN